jgi:hypothetical protein
MASIACRSKRTDKPGRIAECRERPATRIDTATETRWLGAAFSGFLQHRKHGHLSASHQHRRSHRSSSRYSRRRRARTPQVRLSASTANFRWRTTATPDFSCVRAGMTDIPNRSSSPKSIACLAAASSYPARIGAVPTIDSVLGVAIEGLSRIHSEYLAMGGDGFLLGDGTLRYGPEQIAEVYYNIAVIDHLTITPGSAIHSQPRLQPRSRSGALCRIARARRILSSDQPCKRLLQRIDAPLTRCISNTSNSLCPCTNHDAGQYRRCCGPMLPITAKQLDH